MKAAYVVDINGFDGAVVVKADLVPGVERVPVARDEHVLVSVEHDSNRAAQLRGSHGGHHADVAGTSLLSSEASLRVFLKLLNFTRNNFNLGKGKVRIFGS